MARRATFFQSLRTDETLFLGLGYELAPFSGAKDNAGIQALTAAYARLRYDLFMLAAPEQKHTPSFARPYPRRQPELVVKKLPAGVAAFVLFPEKDMSEADEDHLVRFAGELRQSGRYNLIIGLSCWGADREQNFLERRGEAFDMLFGSGDGPGYPGLYLRDDRVLWVRPSTRGKVMLAVTIPELPAPGTKVVWKPDSTVMVHTYPLNGNYAADPEVDKLFNP